MPLSFDQAPKDAALIGNIITGNIGGLNSSWSTSNGQDTDAPVWCSFSNRGSEHRKGERCLTKEKVLNVSFLLKDRTLPKVYSLKYCK